MICEILLLCSGPAALVTSLAVFYRSAGSFNKNVVRRAIAVSTFVLFSVSYSYVLINSPESRAGMIEELSWLVAAVFGFYFGYRVVDRWNLVRIAEVYGNERSVVDRILQEFVDVGDVGVEGIKMAEKTPNNNQQNQGKVTLRD